ncbi:Anucleate primary sterigmata protein B [Penicillium rubens]|uniref:Pc20g08430 protein n=2 Tax=Penicillium chrysogenum species complex TaxID=254878 RepID=B6HEX3_PENRW|nr:Anucleate primary sterigmata protein B [Penicillium rubens]KZN86852.1 Anucleate primary sterigmata protein PcApsB [Penicillium chrysogenum]CAP86172.1 Pc20g08430 [Penicillium rubens Wisconsin 54-1255]
MSAHSPIEAGSEMQGVDTQTLGVISLVTTVRTSVSAFQTPDQSLNDLSTEYFMAEDAPGGLPPNSVTPSQSEYAQSTPSEPDHEDHDHEHQDHEDPEFTMTSTQLDLDDHSFIPSSVDRDESSLFHPSSEHGDHERANNQTLIEEHEMRRKLMDIESSFLPEPSTIDVAAAGPAAGADDTYLVGVPKNDATNTTQDSSQLSSIEPAETNPMEDDERRGEEQLNTNLDSAPGPAEQPVDNSLLDSLSSSPMAAAALRRNQSTLSENARDTSQLSQDERPFRSEFSMAQNESQLTPSKLRNTSRSLSPGASHLFSDQSGSATGSRRASRPKYLTSRQSAHRLSHSSVASNNTETTNSDATLGADYALQTGGATSDNYGSLHTGSRAQMARTTSLGSMASGISGYSEENPLDKRNTAGPTDGGLHTLEEEGSPHSRAGPVDHEDTSTPVTPKAKPQDSNVPTDTAIAERVKGIQIPTAFAHRFREDFQASPEKRLGASTPAFAKSGRNLTLKEQSSTIDRLAKENFDLKMRIHFLNEALNKRSEEGIKEMISENVELKSDKVKLSKDNQNLRRKIRDLEKQVKDHQSDKDSMVNHDPEGSDDGDRDSAQDEEIVFLRERVETYELEIERMRSETIARESEKRRLAEMVKSLSDNRAGESDAGAREEREMWKDMLDAETSAREQAEEENRRLRDESIRLRTEMYSVTKHGQYDSLSYTSDRDGNRAHTVPNSTLVVELGLLKQENAELRKEVSAQTSMLTSRNREKERLYQEIEELKLGERRHVGRSIAGDSIFDRSASRTHVRPPSQASDGTGMSRSDMDRDELEARNGQLRDLVSTLKLENQAIRAELEDYIGELEALDKAYQADVDQAEEEMQNLQQERDQAVHMANERDAAFQDLRAEAQEELDTLGDELDQKIVECQRMNEDLRNQDENLRVLQAEMRSANEGIIRLEEDAQNNLAAYKSVQQELEETNREMESVEKSLSEANTKVQRLTVQIESSQNEIAFLREEQDGDKIRIGDLESDLKNYHMSLVTEKEKTRELEQRLADERHQREVVGSKEKQDVQRIMNELNREASSSKEEVRRLKKSLSAQEIETSTWRERLMDLENNLRETLGDLSGSRSSLITNIMKLQKELESTALELESVRSQLDEKESLLRNRDALLESHGLESRKLSELLDRERHARRADKQSFESSLKSHQQASRTITQSNSRITDLEKARTEDRKRYASLEQQFKDQLSERNIMFLNIWKRLSGLCGPDWAHSNSLINGNLPSQEVIGNILFWPGFSRNLLLAMKTVEAVMAGFKTRIKSIDHELTKRYHTLELSYNGRIKKLERLEEALKNMRSGRGQSSSTPEISKLRGENRLLKAELNLLQSNSRVQGPASAAAAVMASGPRSPSLASTAESERSLGRSSSTAGAERPRPEKGLARSGTGLPQPSHSSSSSTLTNNNAGTMIPRTRSSHSGWDGGDEKWIHRLHELERRLKSEREGRLLDRSGARKRLEERDAENQKLRDQLSRERTRRGPSGTTADGGSRNRPPVSDEAPSSSEGEGITVDIEV